MAITEPSFGSDSSAVDDRPQDGGEYVINGEKIFVTSGDAPTCRGVYDHCVLGRAAISPSW